MPPSSPSPHHGQGADHMPCRLCRRCWAYTEAREDCVCPTLGAGRHETHPAARHGGGAAGKGCSRLFEPERLVWKDFAAMHLRQWLTDHPLVTPRTVDLLGNGVRVILETRHARVSLHTEHMRFRDDGGMTALPQCPQVSATDLSPPVGPSSGPRLDRRGQATDGPLGNLADFCSVHHRCLMWIRTHGA